MGMHGERTRHDRAERSCRDWIAHGLPWDSSSTAEKKSTILLAHRADATQIGALRGRLIGGLDARNCNSDGYARGRTAMQTSKLSLTCFCRVVG